MDAMYTRQLIYGLFLFIVLCIVKRADAQPALTVAVAANFAHTIELISKQYTEKTGVPVQLTVSSSGRLFALINHGAPFDLYFSADAKRPDTLHEAGLCDETVLYARGRSVLWSRNEKLCSLKSWQDVVNSTAVKNIALANPETAPYGKTAREVCVQLASWPEIEKKLVYGNNVGQAFQYAESEVVDAAFIAHSLALTDKADIGCSWIVEEAAPVEQKACVVAYGQYKKAAVSLLEYATSQETAEIRKSFGYR